MKLRENLWQFLKFVRDYVQNNKLKIEKTLHFIEIVQIFRCMMHFAIMVQFMMSW